MHLRVAHFRLLIKQMSMSSGYSSSAIRERIYFGDDMSGVLLYTGSADKEGSLGGLLSIVPILQMMPNLIHQKILQTIRKNFMRLV